MDVDKTRILSLEEISKQEKQEKIKKIIEEVYVALQKKGYDPINQICGYLLSDDPTYITSHKKARCLIRQVEREDVLEEMVREYMKK